MTSLSRSSAIEAAYPAISDYAIIGDCRTTALISRAGAVEWLCLPDYSSPSIFAAILDRSRGGMFRISPAEPFTVQRRYLDRTCVLETTFTTHEGVLRLQDAMVLPSEGIEPQRELLRGLEILEGCVEVEVLFEPRLDYGRTLPAIKSQGALGWRLSHRDSLFLLRSELPLDQEKDGATLRGRIRLRQGERRVLSLSYVRRDVGVALPLGKAARERLQQTIMYWREWSERLNIDGPWQDAVLRSALTLKLLCSATTGAVVAAPTTSLPEVIGGSRNWDYRFCWLRDASLTVEAFLMLGCDGEAQGFLDWLLHATRLTQPRLQVVYDIYGNTRIHEKELGHLQGYAGSSPVRVGNDAWRQHQLDVYGEVCRAAWVATQYGMRLDSSQLEILAGFGQAVCSDWRLPDHGIWEPRGPPRHYTHSKVLCWAALDCLLQMATKTAIRIDGPLFEATRNAIREEIEQRGYLSDPPGYVDALDGDQPDASLLLLPRYGYRQPQHSRMTATYDRITRELSKNELVWRSPVAEDDPMGAEHAFGICGFWAVDYLAQSGRLHEASQRFERLLEHSNDVGLFGEEMDGSTGEPRGNFPQGFTHTGLIIAAQSIATAQRA